MKFRIKEYDKGFVVEYLHSTYEPWFGKPQERWEHYISVSGMEDKPWYYPSFDFAMRGLLDEVKWSAIRNSKNCKREKP